MPPPPRLPLTPAQRKVRTWTAVGLCAGVVLVLLRGNGLLQAIQDAERRKAAPATEPIRILPPGMNDKAVTRGRFRDAVLGRSMDEVLAAFGEPSATEADGRGWVYRLTTLNPVNNGKGIGIDIGIDAETTVRFGADGKAVEVVFPPKEEVSNP